MMQTVTTTTTRPVTFHLVDRVSRVVVRIETLPAGTEVYARIKKGKIVARVCGTLLVQTVSAATLADAVA